MKQFAVASGEERDAARASDPDIWFIRVYEAQGTNYVYVSGLP